MGHKPGIARRPVTQLWKTYPAPGSTAAIALKAYGVPSSFMLLIVVKTETTQAGNESLPIQLKVIYGVFVQVCTTPSLWIQTLLLKTGHLLPHSPRLYGKEIRLTNPKSFLTN